MDHLLPVLRVRQLVGFFPELGGEQGRVVEELAGVRSRVSGLRNRFESSLQSSNTAVLPPATPVAGVAEAGIGLPDGESEAVPVTVEIDGERASGSRPTSPL